MNTVQELIIPRDSNYVLEFYWLVYTQQNRVILWRKTQYMLQNGHHQRVPKVESLDNIIKNMQNLVQGAYFMNCG